MKIGTKVKLIGSFDRDDKQLYGKVIQYDECGTVIVETKDRVVGTLISRVEVV